MGAIFSPPKRPYGAPAPSPVPALSEAETAAAEAASEKERRRRRGGGSTILTSPMGAVGTASVTRKKLLGE